MALSIIEPGSRLELKRGTVAVAIPVFGSYELYTQCLKSVLSHTATDVPLLIADDASPEPAIRKFLEELDASGGPAHPIHYMRQSSNGGFVTNVNSIFETTGDADVVILNSDTVVAEGWLESLVRAADSDSLVATVSTLTNNGTIVSVPIRNQPQPSLPQEWDFEMAANAVRKNSPRLYPRIPTGIGHCLYVKRAAIDLVGAFDEAFSPGYGEEVDFCQRCTLAGLTHVVADDLLVLHHGTGSFGKRSNPLHEAHHEIIKSRYPYYDSLIEEFATDDSVQLVRSLDAAQLAIEGLSVTIDGRVLTKYVTGTQLQTLELIAALAKRQDLRLRVVVPLDLGDYARQVLDALPHVEQLHFDRVDDDTPRTQIVHRPYQISSLLDLGPLASLGDRVVLTYLDLISYFNPGYFASYDHWKIYRDLTKKSLALADQVMFISRHAARSAIGNGLVDPARSTVVHLGTDHRMTEAVEHPVQPAGLGDASDRPFLLCLGTDFKHKNRTFAMELLNSLRTRHDWDGMLVFAGAHVPTGSSAGAEAHMLALDTDLAEHVVDLAAVTEAEKRWLFSNAAAVVYPTVYEGFGLLPFEAAEAGVPCLFAHNTAMAELLPEHLALLVQWDPDASADRVIAVLSQGEQRTDHVHGIKAAAATLTWDRVASSTTDVYRRALASPFREFKTLALDSWNLETVRPEFQHFALGYDRYDLMLIGPSGVLPPEMRRALLGIGSRKLLRKIVFGPFVAAYRLAYRLKNRKSAKQQPPAQSEESHGD